MTIHSFQLWPNHIVLGAGAANTVGEHLQNFKTKKVFIAVDNGIQTLPFVKNMVGNLESMGISVEVYGDILSNPTDQTVNEGLKRIQGFTADAIVAVGGGSAIDTGKAINLVYNLGGDITDYSFAKCGAEGVPRKLSPLIAVPTTAGTGSEVSGASVLIDSKNDAEFFVDSPNLIPDVSILDPEATVSLPPFPTAFTGMDAMTHHVEAYLSNIDSDMADGLCIQGMKMIAENLREAVKNGGNLAAREKMLVASMMGAMAFVQSELGLVHGIALALSAAAGVPHGVGNGMMLPKVVAYNASARPERVVKIAECFGVDTRHMSTDEAVQCAVEELESLNRDIGIPSTLSEVGVTEAMIPRVVKETMDFPILECNPREVQSREVEEMIRKSL